MHKEYMRSPRHVWMNCHREDELIVLAVEIIEVILSLSASNFMKTRGGYDYNCPAETTNSPSKCPRRRADSPIRDYSPSS